MSNKYPKHTSFAWVSHIKNIPILWLIIIFVTVYAFLNTLFVGAYISTKTLGNGASVLDYFYYSFVTSFTIGYGDFAPVSNIGKIIVILHSLIMYLYSALTIAILSVKLFACKESIIFSEKIIYDKDSKRFLFRMINTNRDPLINPEVRISVTQHSVGNVISGMVSIPVNFQLVMLGKHDFSLDFTSQIKFNNLDVVFDAYDESKKAMLYNQKHNSKDSRYRITITITGSYGLQSIAVCKKYYADDVCEGNLFKAIQYNDEDERKVGEMKYTKFPNIWDDFNTII